MELTHHWIQRAGARAAAALTGRPGPAQVGAAELDRVVARIVCDAVAAAQAPKNGPGYAWWLALAAAARPLLESPYLGERGLEPLAGVLDPLAETVAALTAEPHLLEWFLNHRGDVDAWRTWLKDQAVQRLFGDGPPLITPEQWVQLFGDGFAARDHLVVGVLLHHHGGSR